MYNVYLYLTLKTEVEINGKCQEYCYAWFWGYG